jgi:hypothetical protein
MRGRRQIDVLSESDVSESTRRLTVLERVGLRISSVRILESLAEAGAKVDLEAEIVRFPAAMVEEAVAQAPSASYSRPETPRSTFNRRGQRLSHARRLRGRDRRPETAIGAADPQGSHRRDPPRGRGREVSALWPASRSPTSRRTRRRRTCADPGLELHEHLIGPGIRCATRVVVEMGRVVAGGASELERGRSFRRSSEHQPPDVRGRRDGGRGRVRAGRPAVRVRRDGVGTATAPTTLAGTS